MSSGPHVVFLTERFPPDIGGVAASAGRITAALARMGMRITVVTWSRRLPPGETMLDPGPPATYRIGRRRQWDATLLDTMNVLDWLHQAHPAQLLWGHYLFPGGFLAAWYGALKGIPNTASIRGNDLDRELFPPGDFSRLIWTLERAGCVTAVTDDLRKKAQALTRREDVMAIGNAVDPDVFTPGPGDAELRHALGIATDEAVLGFSGELREKKGQTHLLRALDEVRAKRPACLLVIGEVRGATGGFVTPERMIVTGHLDNPLEVAARLRLCDLFLLPSLWEGMPNALLEAMACGLPGISSDAGGIPEIVTHGKDGFLLPRWQLDKLGSAVMEWLDSDRPTRIGIAARERVLADFSPAAEERRLQAVLDRMMPYF